MHLYREGRLRWRAVPDRSGLRVYSPFALEKIMFEGILYYGSVIHARLRGTLCIHLALWMGTTKGLFGCRKVHLLSHKQCKELGELHEQLVLLRTTPAGDTLLFGRDPSLWGPDRPPKVSQLIFVSISFPGILSAIGPSSGSEFDHAACEALLDAEKLRDARNCVA